MNEQANQIFKKICEINDSVATIPVNEIGFYPSLRSLCEMNSCGAYGKNYTCPPLIGEIDDLIEKVKSYDTAIIFRAFYLLEDSFDIEGMNEGSSQFKQLTYQAFDIAKNISPDSLVLGAGGCRLCEKCGAAENIPCRHPDRAISSLEGHGIQVSELASQVGMKYISGQNTVTYFGAVFVPAK
ncbi:MAG: DUF2284 domain-containing protein [Oscillospiraceae bacterium]